MEGTHSFFHRASHELTNLQRIFQESLLKVRVFREKEAVSGSSQGVCYALHAEDPMDFLSLARIHTEEESLEELRGLLVIFRIHKAVAHPVDARELRYVLAKVTYEREATLAWRFRELDNEN